MPEWLTWASAIASVVGGIASVGVLVAALLWRRLAGRLLQAVRGRPLVEELVRMQGQTALVVPALRQGHTDEARVIVQMLLTDVHTVLARRGELLGHSDFTSLTRARDNARHVDGALRTPAPLGTEAIARAQHRAQECAELLAQVIGHTRAVADSAMAKEG